MGCQAIVSCSGDRQDRREGPARHGDVSTLTIAALGVAGATAAPADIAIGKHREE